MRRRSPFTVLVATATVSVLGLGGCNATAEQPPATAEEVSAAQDVAYLWAVGATDASIVTSDGTTFLELRGVERAITRFSDRPHREASEVDLRDFLARWDGRFAEVPPNAVLSYEADPDAAPVQVVVEISRPRYHESTSTIVFAVERIDLTPDRLEGADHPVEVHEVVVPAHTGPVSVFIDSEGPAVTTGQVAAIDAATASSSQAIIDLETTLRQVQDRRAQLLEKDLRAQLETIAVTNHSIGELNNGMREVREALSRVSAGTRPDAVVDGSAVSDSTRAALASYGVTLPQPVTFGELTTVAEQIKGSIDTRSNLQQMDMVRLQSLSNKLNQAFDNVSTAVKRMNDNMSTILRNLR